ncbi:regulator of G-protein signaling 19 isoform X2 [Pocillopora verrucosa]|uniref:regulator of G-protein signaling 19 isoform X2 n=1 Tax=Pocillopora verrucosa TaxID=203993 RepID=UPI00279794E5|nr:regulator of G-protein signaling 19-like isoform X2 [Pocillopora verrucosa]
MSSRNWKSESVQSRKADASWYYDFSEPIEKDRTRSTNTQLEIYLTETNIKKATLEFEEVTREPILSRRKDYCCLCWCFCCSCDWYCPARRFRVGSMETAKDNKYNPKPSREEVQEWGISFEKLLTSKMEKLKKETDQATFKELAQSIYRDYLSAESPKEVSIDHKTRQHIEEVLEEPDQTVYDNAQRHVYYVMYQDCYPRFIVSNVFKALLISND